MSVEVVESGPVERRLHIEVSTADVDAAFERVYRRLRGKARIPGFRAGKAPRAVLERMFGDTAQADAFDELVQQTLPDALRGANLTIVAEPRLSPQGLPKHGTPFVYEATVEIRPTIELQAVRGLNVPRPVLPEPERDPVDAKLEELRLAHATFVEEPAGTPLARGHVAIIKYKGGAGEERSDVEIEIGSPSSLPGLDDGLTGMSVGEQKDLHLDLPADPSQPEAEVRHLDLHVELTGIKRRELAALDDEFAKDVSEHGTLDELRAELRKGFDAARETEIQRRSQEATIDALIAANPFPVPASLVENQLKRRIQRLLQGMRAPADDASLERIVGNLRDQMRPAAERDVRLSFLVDEISRVEKVEVTEADFDGHLGEVSVQTGQSISTIMREYRERGVIEGVRAHLLQERVVAFLISHATVVDA